MSDYCMKYQLFTPDIGSLNLCPKRNTGGFKSACMKCDSYSSRGFTELQQNDIAKRGMYLLVHKIAR